MKPVENEDLFARDLDARESILKKIEHYSGDGRPLFVINPGAKLESKCWPVDYFGSIANWLTEQYNANVVVTGIAAEKSTANEVVKASRGVAINLAGETTVQELVELLRIAKGCITNDTGTMHIAGMVGVPTVAIFSSIFSPTHWFPVGRKLVSIFSPVGCIYCYKESCETLDCLKKIKVDDVALAISEVLNTA